MKNRTRLMAFLLLLAMFLVSVPVFAETEPTTITLSPSYVEIWVNFGTECQLKTTVTGANPSQALNYVTSDAGIVEVSADGNLTPKGEGTAFVYAVATDGSGAVSNRVTVHVLPDQAPPENQKITLGSTSVARINVEDFLAWPKGGYGSANIALWKNNAKGVVTITVDDSIVSNFDEWTTYHNEYGVDVTFFVPTDGGKKTQATWEEMLELGHDVQSHTLTHPSTDGYSKMSSAEEWMDFYLSVKDIDVMLPNKALTVAYSWGYNSPELTSKIFIGGRGVAGDSAENHPDAGETPRLRSIARRFEFAQYLH